MNKIIFALIFLISSVGYLYPPFEKIVVVSTITVKDAMFIVAFTIAFYCFMNAIASTDVKPTEYNKSPFTPVGRLNSRLENFNKR